MLSLNIKGKWKKQSNRADGKTNSGETGTRTWFTRNKIVGGQGQLETCLESTFRKVDILEDNNDDDFYKVC